MKRPSTNSSRGRVGPQGKAIEAKLGTKRPRRGRPPKGIEKYTPVSIRLHPDVIAWAKREAKKRRLGYQTIINEVLLKASA